MKKFFCVLLALVSTLVLLPGCGGGDGDALKMSAEDFARGTKYFMLGNGINGTLYICPDAAMVAYGVQDSTTYETDADGNIVRDPDTDLPVLKRLENAQTASGIKGTVGVGGIGQFSAFFDYVCYYDTEGNPVEGVIRFSLNEDGAETAVDTWLNGAQADGEVTNTQGAIVIYVSFIDNSWETTMIEEGDEGAEDQEQTHGGQMYVQYQ